MRARRSPLPLVAALLVWSCGSTPPARSPAERLEHPHAEGVSAQSATEPGASEPEVALEPVPRTREEQHELAVRFVNARPLQIFRGSASYYSDGLAGRPTASGEPYEPAAYSAAHRTLPFGSLVRVVRNDDGTSVYVRINDRGPFVRGRVLDLSRAAAESIHLLGRGVLEVRAEVVEYGPRKKQSARRKRRH